MKHPGLVAGEAIANRGAMQNIVEFTMLLGFLQFRKRPKIVLEIGSATGGSLWAWQQVDTVERVVSITKTGDEYERGKLLGHGAYIVVGDSTDRCTQDSACHALDGRNPDFIFIDGGHDYDTAYSDWKFALSIAAPDAVIGIHDIWGHKRLPNFGVGELWRDLITGFPGYLAWEFSVDPETAPGTGMVWLGKDRL